MDNKQIAAQLHKALDGHPETFRRDHGRVKDFANEFGFKYCYAYKLLQGAAELKLIDALRIAEKLGMTANDFLADQPSVPAQPGQNSERPIRLVYSINARFIEIRIQKEISNEALLLSLKIEKSESNHCKVCLTKD